MNCVERAVARARATPRRMALWTADAGGLSFADLLELAARAQKLFRRTGLGPGDHALLLIPPGPVLYAASLALAGLGACAVVVEPWLPVKRLDDVIGLVRPKLFVSTLLGRVWGLRVPAVRRIPHFVSERAIAREASPAPFHVESLPPEAPASIAFSSGSTGAPKGVVRAHGYLWELHDLLARIEEKDGLTGPDLSVFPNAVLFHLGTGRGALWVPPGWSRSELATVARAAAALRPETVSCGPGFLTRLLQTPGFASLRAVLIGGALTDCGILEDGFRRWPDARWTQIYGGTEAEPVALADSRRAVAASRARGRFQVLHLGSPIPEIQARLEPDGLWVSGPNVCGEYLAAPDENRLHKRRDERGALWHRMDDRIVADEEGWWYGGRAVQRAEDFELEQAVYALVETSACFVHRDRSDRVRLLGESVKAREHMIIARFPQISEVVALPIRRDRRHRARIDRKASVEKGAPWLAG